MEVLIISDSDVAELADMGKVVELVETVFREKGLKRVQMPPKVYLFFDKYQGDLRAMPAYLESLDIAGVKLVNSHPANPSLHGLPTVMAIVALYDPKTGRPLCLMNGSWITGARTGAAAAVATKYLARRDASVVGLVGAGFIAGFHLEAFTKVMDVEKTYVYDVVRAKAERLAREAEEKYGIRAVAVDSVREAVESADVLATLTPSREPIVKDEWVRESTHINAMGADAPGKEELDPNILRRARVFVDDLEQAAHSGEVNVPISKGLLRLEDICGELGEVVAGLKRGRESEEDVTVFDSTGLAIQDVIVAQYVYSEAVKRGRAVRIEL